jgi:hypothetical protein
LCIFPICEKTFIHWLDIDRNLLTEIETTGEYDRIMQGCYEYFLNSKIREVHGFGAQFVSLHEYIFFFDRLQANTYKTSGAVMGNQAYIPFTLLAFRFFTTHTGAKKDLRFEYPKQEGEVAMRRRISECALDSMLHQMGSQARCWIKHRDALCCDVLSPLLRIMSPTLRQVSSMEILNRKHFHLIVNSCRPMLTC